MVTSTKRARYSAEEATTAQVPPPETQEDSLDFPLLKAATVVCRSHSKLIGLPHVTRSISEFADPICDYWSLESVTDKSAGVLEEASAVRLLDRLLEYGWSGLTLELRLRRLCYGMDKESNEGRMGIVDWWLTKYLPINEATAKDIMKCAGYWNRISVLNRLERKSVLPDPTRFVVKCRHADTAYWLRKRGYPVVIDVYLEISQNNLDFAHWICDRDNVAILNRLEDCLTVAATNNNIAMVQLLTDRFPDQSWSNFEEEHYGLMDLEMIKWLMGYVSLITDCNDTDDVLAELISIIVVVSAKRNRLDIIQFLHSHPLFNPYLDSIIYAAAHGHFGIVQWSYEIDASKAEKALVAAIEGGYLETVKWLFDKHINERYQQQLQSPTDPMPAFKFSIDIAAKSGSLDLVQWLHERWQFGCSKKAMDIAATRGYFDIVSFLHERRSEGCTFSALEGVVRAGNLQMVQWLFANYKEIFEASGYYPMTLAAIHGHLHVVKWLLENQSEDCTINAVDIAAKFGHFDIVKFLIENRSEGHTTEAVDNAASNGHLEILKYFVCTRHMHCNDRAVEKAAANGHFHILLWLRMRGYSNFSENTLTEAVTSGHLRIVKYLCVQCKLRVSNQLLAVAEARNDFVMMEWIMKRLSCMQMEDAGV